MTLSQKKAAGMFTNLQEPSLKGSNLDLCRLVPLVKITDVRGDIGVIEGNRHVPFDIKRIYYSYNTPTNVSRGGHAHKNLHQLILSIAGSFDITIDDGKAKRVIHLDKKDSGLYICPMIWRDLSNFSDDSVCLVLASEYYDEGDYIRSYPEFLAASWGAL